MPTSLGFLKSIPQGGFLSVCVPLNYIDLCGIECDADYEVDWGNGTFISYLAGRVDVVPTGIITIRSASNVAWHRYHTDTFDSIDVQQSTTLNSLNNTFNSLSNMQTCLINDTSSVLDFYNSFFSCSSLSVLSLNCTLATTLRFAFRSCPSLEILTLTDTSNCADYLRTFEGCLMLRCVDVINQALSTTTFNIFYNCVSLVSPSYAEQQSIASGSSYINPSFPCVSFYFDALMVWYNYQVVITGETMECFRGVGAYETSPPAVNSITFAYNGAVVTPPSGWVSLGSDRYRLYLTADTGSGAPSLYFSPTTETFLGYSIIYIQEYINLSVINSIDFENTSGMKIK